MKKSKPRWTQAEDEDLRALAGQFSSRELEKILQRPQRSIVSRAIKLGVKLNGGSHSKNVPMRYR